MLLLFVEIPVCREHLGVQWSPEAAAARALDGNLPTAACFLLIIQLLDVEASAGKMQNIWSFSDICHSNSSNFLKDVVAAAVLMYRATETCSRDKSRSDFVK